MKVFVLFKKIIFYNSNFFSTPTDRGFTVYTSRGFYTVDGKLFPIVVHIGWRVIRCPHPQIELVTAIAPLDSYVAPEGAISPTLGNTVTYTRVTSYAFRTHRILHAVSFMGRVRYAIRSVRDENVKRAQNPNQILWPGLAWPSPRETERKRLISGGNVRISAPRFYRPSRSSSAAAAARRYLGRPKRNTQTTDSLRRRRRRRITKSLLVVKTHVCSTRSILF